MKPKASNDTVDFLSACDAGTHGIDPEGTTKHNEVQQHFNFSRKSVQKVVIAPSSDTTSADGIVTLTEH
ncbi:MAG: hypothetical protein ABIH17_12275 [Pseudomonadota bacterium]